MFTLEDIQYSTVLLRVNFDLPSLENAERIKDASKTIKALLNNKNKVIILSHWNRPNGKFFKSLSMQNQITIISEIIGEDLIFCNQYSGFEKVKIEIEKSVSRLFLLENSRFHPDEQGTDSESRFKLAQNYSTLANFFVDEAFPLSHRNEVTNTEIKEFLPSVFGISFESEVRNLDKLKHASKSPFTVVMGGAKIETKLPLIEFMLRQADHVIISGVLCFTFIQALKEMTDNESSFVYHSFIPDIFNSRVEIEFLPKAKEILKIYHKKIVLPLDFVFEKTEEGCFARDIGEASIFYFQECLKNAQTIFWNGTMGLYEKQPYDHGTLEVAKFITTLTTAYKVVGGGDTNSALPKDILHKFDFVSMGGGATLNYLAK